MGKRSIKPAEPVVGSSPIKKQRVGENNNEVPSAAQLGAVFAGKAPTPRSVSLNDPIVQLIVMDYNKDGSVYGSQFSADVMKVIHMIHDTKPSMFYLMMSQLQEYVRKRHFEDNKFPCDLRNLEAALNCKFVFNNKTADDKDKHTLYVSYRCSVYVQGDVTACKELICFLDAFMSWRITQDEFKNNMDTTQIKIAILTPDDFDMDLKATKKGEGDEEDTGDMDMKFTVSHDDTKFTKVLLTDCPPPTYPGRMVHARVDMLSNNKISIVWSGNTLPFKAFFESKGIGGVTVRNDQEIYGEYYRTKNDISIETKEEVKEVLDLFGEGLMRGSPILVKIHGEKQEDMTTMNAFMDEIQQLPNVYMQK